MMGIYNDDRVVNKPEAIDAITFAMDIDKYFKGLDNTI